VRQRVLAFFAITEGHAGVRHWLADARRYLFVGSLSGRRSDLALETWEAFTLCRRRLANADRYAAERWQGETIPSGMHLPPVGVIDLLISSQRAEGPFTGRVVFKLRESNWVVRATRVVINNMDSRDTR
jgi:hypothetical protein